MGAVRLAMLEELARIYRAPLGPRSAQAVLSTAGSSLVRTKRLERPKARAGLAHGRAASRPGGGAAVTRARPAGAPEAWAHFTPHGA